MSSHSLIPHARDALRHALSGQMQELQALYSEHCIFHHNSSLTPSSSFAHLAQSLESFHKAFSGIHVTQEWATHQQGNLVSMWHEIELTHTGHFMGHEATHKTVKIPYTCFLRFDEAHKIQEAWGLPNVDELCQQLGIPHVSHPARRVPRHRLHPHDYPEPIAPRFASHDPAHEHRMQQLLSMLNELTSTHVTDMAAHFMDRGRRDFAERFLTPWLSEFHDVSVKPVLGMCGEGHESDYCTLVVDYRSVVHREHETMPTHHCYNCCRMYLYFQLEKHHHKVDAFYLRSDAPSYRKQAHLAPHFHEFSEDGMNAMAFHRFMQACEFGVQNIADLGQIVWHDVALHTPAAHRHGDGIHHLIRHYSFWHRAFENIHIKCLRVVSAGNTVVGHLRVEGKHVGTLSGSPPTHREVSVHAMCFCLIDQFRVRQLWTYIDLPNLYHGLRLPLPHAAKLFVTPQHHVKPPQHGLRSSPTHEALVMRLWQSYTKTDAPMEHMEEYVSPRVTFTTNCPNAPFQPQASSLEPVRDLMHHARAPFSNLHFSPLISCCNGARCAMWVRVSGRHTGEWMGHPATNRTFVIDFPCYYEFDAHNCIESMLHFIDRPTKAGQLGVDAPALAFPGSLRALHELHQREREEKQHHPPEHKAPAAAGIGAH